MEDTRLERKALSLGDDVDSIIVDLINEVESKETEIILLNQHIEDLTERNIQLDNKIWGLEHP